MDLTTAECNLLVDGKQIFYYTHEELFIIFFSYKVIVQFW